MKFNFEKASKEDQEDVLRHIDALLKEAFDHKGYVRGPYVRHVLVPRSYDPNCSVPLTEVTILFDYPLKQKKFIDKMIKENKLHKEDSTTYHLVKYGVHLVKINIYDGKNFPTSYDVNYLYYGPGSFSQQVDFISLDTCYTVTSLKEQIMAKKVQVLDDYFEQLIEEEGLKDEIDYLNEHFIDKGWTVRLPIGNKLISFNNTITYEEVMEHINETNAKRVMELVNSIDTQFNELKELLGKN